MSENIENVEGFRIYYDRILGRGNFAFVYECSNATYPEQICVKKLIHGKDKKVNEREINLLNKVKDLQHPNLIKIHQIIQKDDASYIFMQKYKQNLEQWLLAKTEANQKLPIAQILRIAQQIINGYEPLYNNGIIHRDLKPQNILVGDDGQLKISDFGLSKIVKNLEIACKNTKVGTPILASPQCLRNGIYSSRTDVYSLGAVIYYVTFGKYLFYEKFDSIRTFINKMEESLKCKELALPNIENEGNQAQKNTLIQFLNLTITYFEKDRIDWPSLFSWILKGNDQSHVDGLHQYQLDFDFQKRNEDINLKKSSLKKEAESRSESIKKQEQDHSQYQKTLKHYREHEQDDLMRPFPKSVPSLLSLLNITINDSMKLLLLQINLSNHYSNFHLSSNQLKDSLESASLVDFNKCETENSQKLNQNIKKKPKLEMDSQNLIFKFIEVLFEIIKMTDTIHDLLINMLLSAKNYKGHHLFSNFNSIFRNLQFILTGFKYSLLLNGYTICFDDKLKMKTKIFEEIKEFTNEVIKDYTENLHLEVQVQRDHLQNLYKKSLQETTDVINSFIGDTSESNLEQDIITLFFDENSFFDYNNFIKSYKYNFEMLLKSFPIILYVRNEIEFLKFLSLSFKFIDSEKDYPLRNFKQFHHHQFSYTTDNIEILIENIEINAIAYINTLQIV